MVTICYMAICRKDCWQKLYHGSFTANTAGKKSTTAVCSKHRLQEIYHGNLQQKTVGQTLHDLIAILSSLGNITACLPSCQLMQYQE
jgi:hypothetical protein